MMPTVRSRFFWETGSASDIVWESGWQNFLKGRRYELVREKTPALIRVNGIDPIDIEAAGKIIEMAEAAMGPLQHDILIPMADHIAMAAARAREKKEIPNPFQHDIAALFGDEYEAARKGCEILKKMTGTALGEDEAGFIALHIHAGLAQENVADSLETARLVGVCMTMIEGGAERSFLMALSVTTG